MSNAPTPALGTAVLRAHWARAVDFATMLETVERNGDFWRSLWKRSTVSSEHAARAAALGGVWRLLVISEDWCGDAINTVPVLARLAESAPNVELRVIARDEHPELMDAHLTGASRSIPVVIVLDADFNEHGWWGPRPSELQRWVLGDGQALDKTDRYREIRTWYARDQGRTTVEETLALMEHAARGQA